MSVASLSPPTPYTALMSLLSVALSSATAKSNSMILPDACRVNIQPARKACSISAESLLNLSGIHAQFPGLAAQFRWRTHTVLSVFLSKTALPHLKFGARPLKMILFFNRFFSFSVRWMGNGPKSNTGLFRYTLPGKVLNLALCHPFDQSFLLQNTCIS